MRALEELQAHGAMIFATYDVPRILAQARYGAYGMPTLVAAGIFQNGQVLLFFQYYYNVSSAVFKFPH